MVRLGDIAHALALVNRYGGHSTEPYSVAEHSVLVMLCVRDYLERLDTPADEQLPILRAALLHDAGEAYTGDIPTPLKRQIDAHAGGELKRMERRIDAAICDRFELDAALLEHPLIKRCDSNHVLAAEILVLLDPVPGDEWAPRTYWQRPNGREPWPGFRRPWWVRLGGWRVARWRFLYHCARLGIA